MRAFYLLFSTIFWVIITNPVFAHGENLPGPHGGFIRMPGAFHTEVIPETNGFKIMLLDMNFQTPLTRDSSVQARIQSGKKTKTLNCKPQGDHFFCEASLSWVRKKGRLDIQAFREKAKGSVVSYPLPLIPLT